MKINERKIRSSNKIFTGTYAFRIVDENEEHGLWVAYEDPDTAGNKANYVVSVMILSYCSSIRDFYNQIIKNCLQRSKGLGGIAIIDLSMDDFRGACTGEKFTILRAAKYRL
jgi:chitinase